MDTNPSTREEEEDRDKIDAMSRVKLSIQSESVGLWGSTTMDIQIFPPKCWKLEGRKKKKREKKGNKWAALGLPGGVNMSVPMPVEKRLL